MAWEADMGRGVPLWGLWKISLQVTDYHEPPSRAGLGDPRPKTLSTVQIQSFDPESICIHVQQSISIHFTPPKKSKTPPYHTIPPKKKMLYIVQAKSFRVVPGRWKGLCGGTAGIRSVLRALEGCEAVASPSASRFRGGMTCQQRHVFPKEVEFIRGDPRNTGGLVTMLKSVYIYILIRVWWYFCKWSNSPSIMNSEGRGFLAQMDHPSTKHSCVFLYWVHKALATRNPVIPSGLFPSSCAHHPIRFKRPWVPETTPPGARCQAPNHPLPPKVADLRCFFGSAMFTKATLDKVSAATCGVRKTCLELPTRSRVSQHLGRGPGAHGF